MKNTKSSFRQGCIQSTKSVLRTVFPSLILAIVMSDSPMMKALLTFWLRLTSRQIITTEERENIFLRVPSEVLGKALPGPT